MAKHDVNWFLVAAGKVTGGQEAIKLWAFNKRKSKMRLSFSFSQQRNHFSFTTEREVQSLQKRAVPSNSKSANEWVAKNLLERSPSCSDIEGEPIPADFLICTNPAAVCRCLCYLVEETCKTDRTHRPSTIRCLVAVFQWIMLNNRLPSFWEGCTFCPIKKDSTVWIHRIRINSCTATAPWTAILTNHCLEYKLRWPIMLGCYWLDAAKKETTYQVILCDLSIFTFHVMQNLLCKCQRSASYHCLWACTSETKPVLDWSSVYVCIL